jgi:hypothetical protein
MSMGIHAVDPLTVSIGDVYPSDVRTQVQRLTEEGQIEPILVSPPPLMVPSKDAWAYSHEQVAAARALGWPTILVTYREERQP